MGDVRENWQSEVLVVRLLGGLLHVPDHRQLCRVPRCHRAFDRTLGLEAPVREPPVTQSKRDEEDQYWAERANAIQTLYQAWDCNRLSNERFAAQLQSVLGAKVKETAAKVRLCV